ncbi:MAG TPA: hypothetical protein VGN46_18710 [Luteibacter sp.]|uniref:hypothetical protein n=1 Tax=Luteibacter sp. TaxID=1886636 RepID=UPI002F40ADC5
MPTSNLRFRVLTLIALAGIAGLGANSAHAQWQVVDKDANKVLGSPKGGSTINSNLGDIKSKLDITKQTKDNKWVGERVSDPSQPFPKSDSDAIKLDDGTSCKTVAEAQQANCQKIVDIQNAQYKFMVTMYETSKTRDDMLRTILDERKALNTTDYGKLEDNTNKLTALYALIQLDRQQMESVNFAYEANLRYLRAQQTQAASVAQKGGKPGKYGSIDLPVVGAIDVGNMLQDVIGGAVLAETLKTMQTTKPSGMQTLKVTEGF